LDGRKENRGAVVRKRFESRYKVEFVDSVNEYLNKDGGSVAGYFRDVLKCRASEQQYHFNNYHNWSRKDDFESNLRKFMNLPKNANGPKALGKGHRKSPFHEMETELYADFTKMRKESRKVSANWIRIQGKKIFERMKTAHPDRWGDKSFRGTYGWMRRFISRKNTQFRKRKCGKEKTAEECVPEFEKFLVKLRFDFLDPKEGDLDSARDPGFHRSGDTTWTKSHCHS
jgi:hypothetical protein